MFIPLRRAKRRAAGGILVALAIGAAAAGGAEAPTAARPNVLFLLSDDQRFDTIGALGEGEIQTPNLDRLVREGFAFTHAHIMGAQQGAVCMPSRAMLMTGRSLFRATQVNDSVIPEHLALWPQVLQQAGYATHGIGKWHNDRPAFARAFTGGSAIFFGGMCNHDEVPVHAFDPTGKYPKERRETSTTFSSVLFADAAIEFLREPPRQPWALYVSFTAPHDPRTPPEAAARRYDPAQIALPQNFLPEHPFDNGELKVRDERLLPWPREPAAVRQEIALYYAMITHLDAQVGRIRAALEAGGEAANTLIVFAGDNGLAVGQHGLLGKQNLYDHSVRVPLIFHGPGIPRGRRSDALCYLFDVFPTLCELAGVAVPRSVDGRSLVPVLRGRERQVRDAVFAAYRDVQRMVRDPRWKLIAYPKANRLQLFDLAADPDERDDLSADPRHAAQVREMRGKLLRLQQEFRDPMLRRPIEHAGLERPGAPAQ